MKQCQNTQTKANKTKIQKENISIYRLRTVCRTATGVGGGVNRDLTANKPPTNQRQGK